jgi:hypothetical protein
LGSKKENITGWNKQFSELRNMYFSPNIIKVIIYGGWDGEVCSIVYQIQGRGLEFPVGIAYIRFSCVYVPCGLKPCDCLSIIGVFADCPQKQNRNRNTGD